MKICQAVYCKFAFWKLLTLNSLIEQAYKKFLNKYNNARKNW
jgi:hypothetical protein